jgi:hypothetical protein
MQSKITPIEKFRESYGNFNEASIEKACKNGDVEFLINIISSEDVSGLAKGFSIVGISENDPTRIYLDFILKFANSDSPYMREASIMAIYQYLNEENFIEVDEFIKFLHRVKLSSSRFKGVVNKIDSILKTIIES